MKKFYFVVLSAIMLVTYYAQESRLVPCELGEGFVCGFTCSRVHTEYPMLCTAS